MPQPNALDLVRMILASGGDREQMTQLAAMQGDSLPWVSGRSSGGDPNGLDFIDPEGRRLPATHPVWRETPRGTRDDPWGLDAWSDHRERQTGKRIPRTWRGEEPGGAYGFADGGAVPNLIDPTEGPDPAPIDPTEGPRVTDDDLRRWLREYATGHPHRGFASGGAVPNALLQSDFQGGDVPFPQYVDWYQRMYGPQSGGSSDAVDPRTGLAGLVGMAQWLGSPDGVGSTSTTTGSSPQTGVNSTSNSPGMAAVNAAIGAVSPVPGLTSIASMIADALANVSTIGVPGVATNQIGVPGVSISDTLANIATQTDNAVAAGVGTGNNAGQPGQANQPGQAPNVGPTPGIGMAQQTAQQANVGGGSTSPGPDTVGQETDAVGPDGYARGGYLHHALLGRKTSHRPIRRAALGHL